ncbi:MAG: hypothetical protein HWD62_14125 [Cyclobacteriaceae bacterium]|nr:MAG: hypothetical protein HWD62_14125 [Cyclobacteriaceae bacterium]
MSQKFDWITALSVTAGFLILWLFIDREKMVLKIKVLEKEIDENKNLNKEIKQKLKELIENNKDIDPEIANELGQIAALIEIKQDTKAILSLVKIIENLLHKIYEPDVRLNQTATKNGRKRPAFMDYLELAQHDKYISKEDFHLISVAKIIRDEEAHDLDVEKEKSRIVSSFISGISIILTLCRIVKNRVTKMT